MKRRAPLLVAGSDRVADHRDEATIGDLGDAERRAKLAEVVRRIERLAVSGPGRLTCRKCCDAQRGDRAEPYLCVRCHRFRSCHPALARLASAALAVGAWFLRMTQGDPDIPRQPARRDGTIAQLRLPIADERDDRSALLAIAVLDQPPKIFCSS
ncbi:MAG: hypothetical protein E6J90_10005 [Deltaproteobacteria bacterium]|nr:MAG: hypothetical protein E6J90_10005 [Deltaproteobacteria bacterium]